MPFHFGFSKRGDVKVNLHLHPENDPAVKRNLLFRDYIRSHPEVREQYGALKKELAQAEDAHLKGEGTFPNYNLRKSAFIQEVLKKAGFDDYYLAECIQQDEKEYANAVQSAHNLSHNLGTQYVLHKGPDVVGYAEVTDSDITFIDASELERAIFEEMIVRWENMKRLGSKP